MDQKNPLRNEFDEASRFMVRVGMIAHEYGSTPAQIEAYLARIATALGYGGVFRATPTDVLFAFEEDERTWQRLHLATNVDRGLNLDKLADVGAVVRSVIAGDVSVPEAYKGLDAIVERPSPWGEKAIGVSYAVVGAGLAVTLGGGWIDALMATLMALLVYAVVAIARRLGTRSAEWLPLSTAFVVALVVSATMVLIPELGLVLVTISAIAVLLPGFAISLGVMELATGQTFSGLAHLMDALVFLAKQFLGAFLGVSLVGAIASIPDGPSFPPVSDAWLWLAIPTLILALCVVFETTRKDIPWAFACAVAAVGASMLGSAIANDNFGTILGAVVAAVIANLWSGWTRRPLSIVLRPGVIVLVSGSIGFQGLAAIAQGETQVGTEQFIQMFVVGLMVTAGLLVGNTIVRPRATL